MRGMRVAALHALFTILAGASLSAELVSFENARFTLDIPADWKKAKGPDDGNFLYREAPGGEGSFSVYKLKVAKDHRAELQGTLKHRVDAITKSGLKVTADVKGTKQDFDGKHAVFAVIPVEAGLGDRKVKFSYYLVLIDAKNLVVIMQATLPRKPPDKLREATLGIIQSFREKE